MNIVAVHGYVKIYKGGPTFARQLTALCFVQHESEVSFACMQIDGQFLFAIVFDEFEAAPLVAHRVGKESTQEALTVCKVRGTDVAVDFDVHVISLTIAIDESIVVNI